MERIYLDNAATTSLGAEVLNSMMPVMTDVFGNTSSVHSFGRDAARLVDESRDIIANSINAKSNEIYFTASGCEANTWAMIGIANANRSHGNHIITSKIEHPSIMEACKYLEKNGFSVTYLDVDQNGFIRFVDPHRYEVPPQRTTAAGPPAPAPPVHPPAERTGPPPGYSGWG